MATTNTDTNRITILDSKKKSISVCKNSLKFMSWNIQAPSTAEGNKFQIKEFRENLVKNDFICLQETRRDVHLSGYRVECNNHKANKFGGVAILVKSELKEGIEFIKDKNCPDYLVCRLKKTFFRQDEDIYLVNVYARPHNTSEGSTIISGRDVLAKTEEIVNDLTGKGEIILCGDFNARIAHLSGMIENDSNEYLPMPDDYTPDDYQIRNSQDNSTNSYCKQFINLISNNQLRILNGRTLGDFQGQFTSIQKNGCSVIDYFAVSPKIQQKVNYLQVNSLTMNSDHKPLVMELRCPPITVKPPVPLDTEYDKASPRFIFNDTNKEIFTEAQSSDSSKQTLQSLHDILTTITINDTDIAKSIKDINNKFTEHIKSLASTAFKQTKTNSNKKQTNNNPWFNWQTRLGKRELRNSTNIASKFPTSDLIRENYYRVKGNYRRLLKKFENKYFGNLNKDIEEGRVLNWQSFKKLKKYKTNKLTYDSSDMSNFETFFSDLYSDKHNTINSEQKNEFMNLADNINHNPSQSYPENLNEDITSSEVRSTIKSLKSGKASATDMISNEILKCFDLSHIEFLTSLFNLCFNKSIYPWNESIITPLLKKGDVSNPDNYRAIAVSSVLGKVFSTILLERLKSFKKTNCPDPPNQLGFTKGAQTYDHILTMQTIANKYKKMHKPVYAVFVDFKKAFDSVCRQALFYKLAKLGVRGKFYSVLKNMYTNSFAFIKLSGHLSKKIDIRKGTEQGHPLSPDLFKIFINDLSPLLEHNNCPELSNKLISHLLWADDLIMLSLSPENCQLQINALGKFCNEWGIEINEVKTQIIIFGKNSVELGDLKFTLLGNVLKIVENYCYLGLILTRTGELKTAHITLKNKAIRAFFGLKRTVIRSKLSFKALNTLFDSLIKPIVLYGAPIWTPTSTINKSIIKYCKETPMNVEKFIAKINRSISEKVHLSFLKWALGVHRKASNIGVWGESGRYPLIYQSIRLTLNYYKRVSAADDNTFIKAALKEQKLLKLPWFKNIEPLLKLDEIFHMDHVTAYRTIKNKNVISNSPRGSTSIIKPLPSQKFRVQNIIKTLTEQFIACWKHEKSVSPKLSFYNNCKGKFARESYLDVTKGFSRRYSTSKFRISSHDLEIEQGRYTNTPRELRVCAWCQLSIGVNVLEDENHLLYDCDLYSGLRSKLITNLNNAPQHQNNAYPQLHVDVHSLKSNFAKLLSPFSHPNPDSVALNSFNIHHKIQNLQSTANAPEHLESHKRRSYIINCMCTYLYRAMEKRRKYINNLRELESKRNTLVIYFNNSIPNSH